MIDRRMIGGSCPNLACLPSKNIIQSAKVAALAARGQEFGLELGTVQTNMRGVQRRKRKMVDDLIKVHLWPTLVAAAARTREIASIATCT